MAIIRKYKSGWQIKIGKRGNWYLYKDGEAIPCDNKKDCQFIHWCLTH